MRSAACSLSRPILALVPGMPEQAPYRRTRVVIGILCFSTLAFLVYRKNQDRSFYKRWAIWTSYSDTLESWRSISSALRLLSQDISSVVHGRSSEECPGSVRRVLALATSPHCINAISKVVEGLAPRTAVEPAIVDKLIEAALSDRGQNLVGFVVGISTLKAVQAVSQAMAQTSEMTGKPALEANPLLVWLASPAAQSLVCRSVATFVSTGVSTYCDKTAGEDVYGGMMQALAKPKHLEAVQALASTVCRTSITAAAQSMQSPPEPTHYNNGGVKGTPSPQINGFHMRQSQPQPQHAGLLGQRVWTEEVIHACASPDVRQTVAQVARAGCAGAVEAGITAVSQQLPSSRHAHLIATVLLSWLLLLPLWLLHTAAIPPGQTQL